MSQIIASVSGVRGITGDSLTPQNIIKFTTAFAIYCRKHSKSNKIAVGRDGRLHGELISDIVVSTLSMAGFQVINTGVVPTPTLQIATEDLKCAGGIEITASHNPQIWNGLKFLNSDGTFPDAHQIKEITNIAETGEQEFVKVTKILKPINDFLWIDKHIQKVLNHKLINIKKIKSARFKVVVDAVNSAASVIAPKLLHKLGCKVIELYCDGSGIFPHTPEPLPKNLKLLCKSVVKHKADMGIAIDPDSDRLVFITEKGLPFVEENTIVAFVKNVIKNSRARTKNITVNLSTTRAVEDIACRYGGKVFRSPVGEINVVKEMQKNKSIAGGEGSGGVILPDVHYGRDAIIGIGVLLQEFADSGLKLSDYKKTIPCYFILKTKIENVVNADLLFEKIYKKYKPEMCRITTTDGLKLDFAGHWIHLRKSNTEPIVRIIIEAKSKEHAEKIQEEFLGEVEKYI
jgi:phosphomannomutase